MPATICYIDKPITANTLFKKPDIAKSGSIDETGLKTAAGSDSAATSKSAELLKQNDTNDSGKVTKSPLSAAIDKVGDQLSAQFDQSRTTGTKLDKEAHGSVEPSKKPVSDSSAAPRSFSAVDTITDTSVSADKKVLADANSKTQAQLQQYKNIGNAVETTASSGISVSA